MKHKLSHQHRLLQKMALTPLMRQSIQLLGMSVSDINEYVDSLITKNPFLQKLIDEKKSDKFKKTHANKTDGDSYDYAESARQEENPRFNILSQLKIAGLDKRSLEIAEYLVFEMDENGYIATDPEAAAQDLSVEPEDIDKCLETIKKMEPAGIGARDIRECLMLQLERKGKADSIEYEVVSRFLNDVAQNNIEKIAKGLKADKKKVTSAIDIIKKLNPRPASSILSTQATPVIPELVAKVDEESVRLELNRSAVPRLKIYNPYANDLDLIKDPEARKFLKENMGLAEGLIGNLKRREDTICKVAKHILDFQKDSLTAEKAPKTLTLNDVAGALGFHLSTVSRAVSNKYIQLNDKVIPMKSLLSHGVKKENGELASKTSIRQGISEMVKNEDSSSPLKDSQIESILKSEGIVIKRRTVAKYRKTLRILPAYLRKKVKETS